jgi:hypothetical protein
MFFSSFLASHLPTRTRQTTTRATTALLPHSPSYFELSAAAFENAFSGISFRKFYAIIGDLDASTTHSAHQTGVLATSKMVAHGNSRDYRSTITPQHAARTRGLTFFVQAHLLDLAIHGVPAVIARMCSSADRTEQLVAGAAPEPPTVYGDKPAGRHGSVPSSVIREIVNSAGENQWLWALATAVSNWL